ncbi:unnamed protein product [Allacma fusca]|uniref:Uncharacterized protein n=1 Tax=Allacma fusca TaxID=39272 RepID=A0A8J2J6W8_9HEXA|nr:unnamed protein product [Allacma fusca]
MNYQSSLTRENPSPYQPIVSEWLSLPSTPRSAFQKYPQKDEKSVIRDNSKIVAQKLREFENELENSFYRKTSSHHTTRRLSASASSRLKDRMTGETNKNDATTLLTKHLVSGTTIDYDVIDPLLRIPVSRESPKMDAVAVLAKAYGPLGLPVAPMTKPLGVKSQNYSYKTPATVPLSPARYLMFRQPSQTGSVTSRLKTVKSVGKSYPVTGMANQRKKYRLVIDNSTPITVTDTGSKILNIKKYDEEVKPKASPSKSKTASCCPSPAKNKISKTNDRVRSIPPTPAPALPKSRSRSIEHDPRPSVASILNPSIEILPQVLETDSEELGEETMNSVAINNTPNNSTLTLTIKKTRKPTSTKSMKTFKKTSAASKQLIQEKGSASEVEPEPISEEKDISKVKESTTNNKNNTDCKSTTQSLASEAVPLKGILKTTKSHTEKPSSSPWSNMGLCTAQPGTAEWTNYWEKYDKALSSYKLSEAAFLQENQSYRQDIEKYSKEAARINLEDAIFRQSIGLEPKKIHEVIGHPITELTTLNGFVFDRNCGSEGLLAYLSSCGSKGFRLEIDVRGQDPDKVKVETDFNLVKIQVPLGIDSGNSKLHKSLVIGLPHEYDLKDLEIFPVRNGWLVIESKEKKQSGDII